MTMTSKGTAAAAQVILTFTLLHPTTVSRILEKLDKPVGVVHKATTLEPQASVNSDRMLATPTQATSVAAINSVAQGLESERTTTLQEKVVGEPRRWRLLAENWDGEGASAPVSGSLKEAVAFVRLLDEDMLPEPMLHGTGHAGLFWKDDALYADIEFLGDGRVAYYIERQGDKHKGVLNFDSKKMPPVFPALLLG